MTQGTIKCIDFHSMFVQSLRLYCYYIILLFSPMICISLKACTCMHNSEFTQQDGRKNRTANACV